MTATPIRRTAVDLSREILRRYRQYRYFKQRLVHIKCGAFELEAPAGHILVHLLARQPHRESGVGLAAKYLSNKYPNGSFVDIGANIGDTAAVMATYAKNKLILIEPSDYYMEILARNVEQLPNEKLLINTLIADGGAQTGVLIHQHGTAFFKGRAGGNAGAPSRRLSEIADPDTCFVKIDTDGFDFKIIHDSMDWLSAGRPALIFENQIRNSEDLAASNDNYDRLLRAGYLYFIVWDDPGLHLLSTSCLDVLKDLNRFLFMNWQPTGRRSIHNFDVLCLSQRDEDVYRAVRDECRGVQA